MTFFFSWLRHLACRILVPQGGTEPGLQQWKPGILTTRPPGNSQQVYYTTKNLRKPPSWWLRWQRICLQCRGPGFDPWVGMISWRREQLPTPYSGLENSMDYSMGSQTVGNDWVTFTSHPFTLTITLAHSSSLDSNVSLSENFKPSV